MAHHRAMYSFVPTGFTPPAGLDHAEFSLRPLGPEHNESDYAAWTSSLDHIRASPGWANRPWPQDMTLEDNLADLVRHAEDFTQRTGFTYTVLAEREDAEVVIGCVYIYPSPDENHDASVRSWVRAADAHLDGRLHRAVSDWLVREWPFEHVDYAVRPGW
jgi:RimJ/RimL family protein N-acetyltransferase